MGIPPWIEIWQACCRRFIPFIGLKVNARNGMGQGQKYRISNNEPQNYEVNTSTFDIPGSIFCGSVSEVQSYQVTSDQWPVAGGR
jgi:hypothetical protein